MNALETVSLPAHPSLCAADEFEPPPEVRLFVLTEVCFDSLNAAARLESVSHLHQISKKRKKQKCFFFYMK